jgi:signal peptidase
VLLGALILAMAGAVAGAVLVPRLGGATPYTVLTGSMRPALPPGTLVVVRPVPAEQLGIGSVITYQVESGKPTVVTHRVVGTGVDAKGEPIFHTRGDANEVVDRTPVRAVQVKGELWYAVPHLGRLSNLVSSERRKLARRIAAGGLGLYALAMFGGAVRDRTRRLRRERAATEYAHGEYAHG